MWNGIKVGHGKQWHGESQGSVGQANENIEYKWAIWGEKITQQKGPMD